MGPLRTNDRTLIDIFSQYYDIATPVMTSIIRVRVYLEVFTLADIVTGDDTKIRFCFSSGAKNDTKSMWDWHEEIPSTQDFSR